MEENGVTILNQTSIVAAPRGSGEARARNDDKRNDTIQAKNEKNDGNGEILMSSRSPIGNEGILRHRTRRMTRKQSARDATRTHNLELPEAATRKSLAKNLNVAMKVATMHRLPTKTTGEARSTTLI